MRKILALTSRKNARESSCGGVVAPDGTWELCFKSFVFPMKTQHGLSFRLLFLFMTIVSSACGPANSPGKEKTSETSDGDTSASVTGPGTLTGSLPTGDFTSGSDSSPLQSASSSSSGITEESTSFESDGCNVICDSDLPEPGCDIFSQNCAEDEKCVAYSTTGGGWNANKCVKITGDRKPGEACTTVGGGTSGIDDCEKGAMCWNVNSEGKGNCVAQCTGSAEMPICPDDILCSVLGLELLALCFPSCNPLLQDCPGDELCVFLDNEFWCIGDDSDIAGQANDACEFASACDKGFLCLEPDTASASCDPRSIGCCQPFCKFPDSPCPNPDQKCVQLLDPENLPPGDTKLEVGICKLP